MSHVPKSLVAGQGNPGADGMYPIAPMTYDSSHLLSAVSCLAGVSKVPAGGVTEAGWQEGGHRVILDGRDRPNKEYDVGQEQQGPFGTTAQARHGRRCGLPAGSPAGAGRGDHSLPRAPTRGTPKSRRRSAPSMANAVRTGSPTATATAAEIGTPGWGRWNCASPRSGMAVTSPACWNRAGAARRRCWW